MSTSNRTLGPRPDVISFDPSCFAEVPSAEYEVPRSGPCAPAVFAVKANAETFAAKKGRTVTERRRTKYVRITWR